VTTDAVIFGEHDQRVVDQLRRCVAAEEGARGVLCADGHLGYSAPIGGVMAYRDHVSPSGVGYDIGCGNLAVRTDLAADDVRPDLAPLMDRVFSEISFGMGRVNDEPVDHPVLDAIREAEFAPQRALHELAARQLGTVGAGNHYVDLFSDETGALWVGVHFGSRGFGHKTASMFTGDGPMDSPPTLLHAGTERGQAYITAMEIAGRYAYAGREVVVAKVLEIVGARATEQVHNNHNFAWREEHGGESWWVVRKGATPAAPGQRGFVGATMGEDSVILEGVDSARSAQALYSTVHGAGRAMSRTTAGGRWRRRHGRLEQTKPGAIDWDAARADLRARGIELRGAAADEAPGAYKRLNRVLEAHAGTVRVLHTLTPMGVAMAGPDVYDPFKD
jgi:tRNA-splicing ligase RtcB (3'-phosphate/5'-hydroxy nucleic acid ligase)